MSRAILAALALAALASCGGFGEETLFDPGGEPPTWTGGIEALLAARCVRCHQSPPLNGAPPGFRLDKYDRFEGNDGLNGAFEMRSRILIRAVIERTMPFGGPPLPADERGELRFWVESGAPFE